VTKMEKLLTAQQVADHLGMHVKTLYKLLRENQIALNFIRVNGRTIAFRPADVQRYLDEREVIRTGNSPKKPRKQSRPKTNGSSKDRDFSFLTDPEARAFFAMAKTNPNLVLNIIKL
jgi:excisionase family DNA binding protein